MTRGIPFHWRLIDCSFCVFGMTPLVLSYKYVKKLEKISQLSGCKILKIKITENNK